MAISGRCALLIPPVWLHRLVFRGIGAVRKGALTSCIVRDEKKIGASGRERVKMFRRLGMMD